MPDQVFVWTLGDYLAVVFGVVFLLVIGVAATVQGAKNLWRKIRGKK